MLKELNNFSVDARFPKVISSLPTLSDMTLVCQLSLSLSLRSNPIINNLTIVLEKNNLIYLIATAIKKVSVKQFIPFPIFSRFSMRSRMVIGISLVSLEISFHPHFFPLFNSLHLFRDAARRPLSSFDRRARDLV